MGMSRCVLRDCPSRKQKTPVSMFKPPNDPYLFAEWQNVLEHKCINYVLSNNSRVCEYHFQPAEIIRGRYKKDESGNKVFVKSTRPHLETNAIPSIVDFFLYDENTVKQDENNKNCQNQQPAEEISSNTVDVNSSLNEEIRNPGENNSINDLQSPPDLNKEITPRSSCAIDTPNDKEAATSRSNSPSSFCDIHVLDETSRSNTPLSFYAVDESTENELMSRSNSPSSDCVVDKSKENESILQNNFPICDSVVDKSKENDSMPQNNSSIHDSVIDKSKENDSIPQNNSSIHDSVVDDPKENELLSQYNSPMSNQDAENSNKDESTMIQGETALPCCVINMSDENESSTTKPKSEMIINVRISVKRDISVEEPVKQDVFIKKNKISSNLSNMEEDIPTKRARFEENVADNQTLEVTRDNDLNKSFEKKSLNSSQSNVNSRKLDMSAFLNSRLKLPDLSWAQTSHDGEVFFSKLTVSKFEKKVFIEKQIVVPKDEDVKVYILDKIILINSGNPTTLVGLRQLIKKVNEMEVCEGARKAQENIVHPCAYKDKSNVWRHNNCDIVLKSKKVCKFCASLVKKK